MLGKALTKVGKPPSASSPEESRALSEPGSKLAAMLSVSGRIGLSHLQRMRLMYDKEDFVNFMARPALIGAAIVAGTLYEQPAKNLGDKNRTVAFEPLQSADDIGNEGDALKHAIYPLLKSTMSHLPVAGRTIFLIGRANDNDMIMPDFSISKRHALLQIEDELYWLKDYKSTNGTLINDRRLDEQLVQLNDGDVISFARYAFIFLSPASLYDRLR